MHLGDNIMNRAIKKLSYQNRFVDTLIVFGSWMFAYALRFELKLGGQASDILLNRYLGYGLLLSLVCIIVFKNSRVYETTKFDSASKEIINIVKASFIAFFVFLALSFFSSHERLSRILLGTYLATSTILLVIVKLYFRNILLKLPIKIVLVGHGESIKKYYSIVKDFSNYKILNWFDAPEENKEIYNGAEFDPEVLEKENCDGIVIGFDTNEANQAQTYIEKLSKFIMPIMVLPDVQYAKLGYSMQNFKGIPVLSINEPNAKAMGLIIKRIVDFLSCSIGMLLISPLLIIISILVKLTSKGPIFYSQVRMGVDGNEFKMWKFRSMVIGKANSEGWTVKNDPRITWIGRFIRRTSIDELPQLWNVIIGDMSLVGPRPERPVFVDQFRKEIPDYMLRHKFKAGITGWAQINGWRGDTSIEKRIECDIWYIKNWSFWLDISIIFLTFWKGFVNKNAY
jgi:Undecaprenyl-phosphate glucose phosphotransferase